MSFRLKRETKNIFEKIEMNYLKLKSFQYYKSIQSKL